VPLPRRLDGRGVGGLDLDGELRDPILERHS
jgi:hypothetical protein